MQATSNVVCLCPRNCYYIFLAWIIKEIFHDPSILNSEYIRLFQLLDADDVLTIKNLDEDVIRLLKEVDKDEIQLIRYCLHNEHLETNHRTDDLLETQNTIIILTSFVVTTCSLIALIKFSFERILLKRTNRLHQEYCKEKVKQQKEVEREIFQLKDELSWVNGESKLSLKN